MSGASSGNRVEEVRYVYELPFTERKMLCNILDMDNQWERLGGQYMGFKVHELYEMRRVEKCGESPCDRLLQVWGHQNSTVATLYLLLCKMKHYQAMKVLLPFIPTKFHSLAFQGEQTFSKAFPHHDAERNATSVPSSNSTVVDGDATCQGAAAAVALPKPPPELLVSSRRHTTRCSSSIASKPSHESVNASRPAAAAAAAAAVFSQEYQHNLNSPKTIQENTELPLVKPDLVSKKIVNIDFIPNPGISCEENEHGTYPSAEENFDREYKEKAAAKLTQLKAKTPPAAEGVTAAPQSSTLPNKPVSSATEASVRSDNSTAPSVPLISFHELTLATDGWSTTNLLGKGGFGEVYWGTWKNTEVAVKKINENRETVLGTVPPHISQTMEELHCLQAYRHDNILQLYGCSVEPGQPACLVYQFMANGSVEDRLQCKRLRGSSKDGQSSSTAPLDWWLRLKIARGTAKALQFLHTVKSTPLIHGDIKSANILLDGNFEPKLGDFGLAKEGPYTPHTSQKVSKVHGTRPYIPDEYLRDKKRSTKVDCYSYGVVLFELCTGLRAYDEHRKYKYLKELVSNVMTDSADDSLQDTKAGYDHLKVFSILLQLGQECVVRIAKNRPDMTTVYQKLDEFYNRNKDMIHMRLASQSLRTDNTLGSIQLPSYCPSNPSTNPYPSTHYSIHPSTPSYHGGGTHSPAPPLTGPPDLQRLHYHSPHLHHQYYYGNSVARPSVQQQPPHAPTPTYGNISMHPQGLPYKKVLPPQGMVLSPQYTRHPGLPQMFSPAVSQHSRLAPPNQVPSQVYRQSNSPIPGYNMASTSPSNNIGVPPPIIPPDLSALLLNSEEDVSASIPAQQQPPIPQSFGREGFPQLQQIDTTPPHSSYPPHHGYHVPQDSVQRPTSERPSYHHPTDPKASHYRVPLVNIPQVVHENQTTVSVASESDANMPLLTALGIKEPSEEAPIPSVLDDESSSNTDDGSTDAASEAPSGISSPSAPNNDTATNKSVSAFGKSSFLD